MPKRPAPIPPLLLEVREHFEEWRADKPNGARIPEELWDLAVSLVSEFGLHRTARVLRLDYARLRNRCAELEEETPQVTFVEALPTSRLSASTTCEIAFEATDGATLRVRLGAIDVEAITAIASFLLGGAE